MTETDIQSCAYALLTLATTLRRYETERCQASGEQFNLFNILGISHYEVRTHSPMLAELLNPQGSHGQGAVFPKKFLDGLKISDFDADSARVDTEVKADDLGRLDIEVKDKNQRAIFIENKIGARLQYKQLTRYHEHNTEATLLFLTLNGDDPSTWRQMQTIRKRALRMYSKPYPTRSTLSGGLKNAVKRPPPRTACAKLSPSTSTSSNNSQIKARASV